MSKWQGGDIYRQSLVKTVQDCIQDRIGVGDHIGDLYGPILSCMVLYGPTKWVFIPAFPEPQLNYKAKLT